MQTRTELSSNASMSMLETEFLEQRFVYNQFLTSFIDIIVQFFYPLQLNYRVSA